MAPIARVKQRAPHHVGAPSVVGTFVRVTESHPLYPGFDCEDAIDGPHWGAQRLVEATPAGLLGRARHRPESAHRADPQEGLIADA